MKRYIVIGSLLLLGGGGAAAWTWLSAPSRVKVVSIKVKGEEPGSVVAHDASRPSAGATQPRAAGPATPDPLRIDQELDGNKLIDDLVHEFKLADDERQRLLSVMKSAAEMQKRIDKRSDPQRRFAMQEKLSHQLSLRLLLVLGEERAKETRRLLHEKNPRIVLDRSTDT